MKSIRHLILFILLPFTTSAQVSGNQVYGNNGHNNNSYQATQNYGQQKRSIVTTESTLDISVNLLLNKRADYYLITIGVNQEGETVLECNKKINSRIKSFNESLAAFGVKKDELYIDFISQTKIYDYEVGAKQAQQFQTGYEIKKNIIIKLTDIDDIDQLIERASENKIYDLIKVEYIDEDVNKTYSELYKEAVTMIKTRLKLYKETATIELTGNSTILMDNFHVVSPKTQYRNYQAFETSNLNVHHQNSHYSQHYVQKETRKQRTFYYDGIPASGYDKIINSGDPKVGLQYVFSLSMRYELKQKDK